MDILNSNFFYSFIFIAIIFVGCKEKTNNNEKTNEVEDIVDITMKTDTVIKNHIDTDSVEIKENQKTKKIQIAEVSEIQEFKIIEEETLYIVDTIGTKAEFPGGMDQLNKFINENLRYPVIALENGIQGRVIVQFVIDTAGVVDDVKVLRGFDKACDIEAIRVVKKMPRWIPALQNGIKRPTTHRISVTFRIK